MSSTQVSPSANAASGSDHRKPRHFISSWVFSAASLAWLLYVIAAMFGVYNISLESRIATIPSPDAVVVFHEPGTLIPCKVVFILIPAILAACFSLCSLFFRMRSDNRLVVCRLLPVLMFVLGFIFTVVLHYDNTISAVVVTRDRVIIFRQCDRERVNLPRDVNFKLDTIQVAAEKRTAAEKAADGAFGVKREGAHVEYLVRIGDFKTDQYRNSDDDFKKLKQIDTALRAPHQLPIPPANAVSPAGAPFRVGPLAILVPAQWQIASGSEERGVKAELQQGVDQMMERYRDTTGMAHGSFGMLDFKALRLPNDSGWCMLDSVRLPPLTDYYTTVASDTKQKLDWGLQQGLLVRIIESGTAKVDAHTVMRTIVLTKSGGRMITLTYWTPQKPSEVTQLIVLESKNDPSVSKQVDGMLVSLKIHDE